MTLDELSEAIREVSDDPVAHKLAGLLLEWKADDRTADELCEGIERFFGNTWIDNNEEFSKLYEMWSAFRSQAIDGIGGMTMNERLWSFGLFNRFDLSQEDEEKRIIYRKLHAKS